MSVKQYTALLAAFMVANVHATPSATVSVASTPVGSASAEVTCKFQVDNSAHNVMPVGTYIGAEDASGCWEVCNDTNYSPYCESFTYTPATKTCVFINGSIRSGVEPADSGTYYWDKACWADYPASASATPTPGCLDNNATCGDYTKSPTYEEFATFRRATGGASECSKICNGATFASRCKSYIHQDDEVASCYFYDLSAAEIRIATDGGRLTAWNKECLEDVDYCTPESK